MVHIKEKIKNALGFNTDGSIRNGSWATKRGWSSTLNPPAPGATPTTPPTFTITQAPGSFANWYDNSHKVQDLTNGYNNWFLAHPKTSKTMRVVGAGMGFVPTFVYVAQQVPGPGGVALALGAATGMGIVGAARPAAGIITGLVETYATTHPVTKTTTKVVHDHPADLEAELGHAYHMDSNDVAKDLTDFLQLSVDWNNVTASNVNYILAKDGTGSVDITLQMKDGGVLKYNDGNVKTLSPDKARDAFAISQGHHNSDGNNAGDVNVYTTPAFDGKNLSWLRPIAKADAAQVSKYTGIADAKAIEVKVNKGTVSYTVYGKDGKAVPVANDKVEKAFNYVEDGDLTVDHFGKVVDTLEKIVTPIWSAAQSAQREDWNTTYALGLIAAEHNLNISSDWDNLTTKDGLVGYITSWASDHNTNVNITYLQNLNNTQLLAELSAMADTDGKSVTFNGLRGYVLAKLPNMDKTNLSLIKGMTESDANRTKILNILYDKTLGTGSDAGYQKAVNDAIAIAIKDGVDVKDPATLEQILKGIYDQGENAGYEHGLQETRLYQWMGNITSDLFNTSHANYLAGADANSTLNQWEVNAGIHPDMYSFFAINSGENVTKMMKFYGNESISNATKNWTRGYLDNGATVKFYNLANAKDDKDGNMGTLIAAFKNGKYVESRITTDAEYKTAKSVIKE
jgi:hypothetical protein